jgi:cob(I)alamin adenosyltransferase
MTKGLIQVYTGEGKGKTTAAFGLAMRAAGHGRRVLILQFLKSRIRDSGEIRSARKCGIEVIKFRNQTAPIFDPTISHEELSKTIRKAVTRSIRMISSGEYDLVVMEEFNNALGNGYVPKSLFQAIIDAKPPKTELVFTGRRAPEFLIEIADYVTEMKMVKHPADRGVKARKGIEF